MKSYLAFVKNITKRSTTQPSAVGRSQARAGVRGVSLGITKPSAMYKYFEPKKFEQWRGRSIYEFLGVKFFKKYLLPDQLLLTRMLGKKEFLGGRGKLAEELKRLEWETKRNEVIHLLALFIIVCILLIKGPALSILQILYILIINLYVNLYPIFVQRYNRFRLKRLLHDMGNKT